MAQDSRSPPLKPASTESLVEVLAKTLPEGVEINCYHVSTPPTRCTALFSPPPSLASSSSDAKSSKSQKTYRESHSLLVTLSDPDQSGDQSAQVALFAIEVQIFTTATLTTVFISKADSTGWLALLPKRPPRSSSSVLQTIAATFVSWIIRHRHRPDRPLVLSLFARAQNQYLFPGSVKNSKKHVLDDRALVKWWCKTLDPVLRDYNAPSSTALSSASKADEQHDKDRWRMPSVCSKAHLIVPGHEPNETQFFFPQSARLDPPANKRWYNAHPLRQIAPYPNAPPRCLVPHFPDDPKARLLNELDEEIANAALPTGHSAASLKFESPTKRGKGQWKSVKSLEQFWERMTVQQECSSGRLVGFIWILFTLESPMPHHPENRVSTPASPNSPISNQKRTPKPTKSKIPVSSSAPTSAKRPKRSKFLSSRTRKIQLSRKKDKRTGPIIPRSPRVKGITSPKSKPLTPYAKTTKYYHSPPEIRGTLVLSQKAYDRMHELFLRLDFSNLESSKASTRRWLLETSVVGTLNDIFDQADVTGTDGWGRKVIGRRAIEELGTTTQAAGPEGDGVTMLAVKRKRKNPDTNNDANPTTTTKIEDTSAAVNTASGNTAELNMLTADLVRKKPKLGSGETVAVTAPDPPTVAHGARG